MMSSSKNCLSLKHDSVVLLHALVRVCGDSGVGTGIRNVIRIIKESESYHIWSRLKCAKHYHLR